ncbi:MAG: DUF559 domain-containing protein [Sporichthyaceae bacterium]
MPQQLLSRPFRREEALDLGMTSEQLRSKCWLRLFPHVYLHRSQELTDEVRFEALRLAAPSDTAFTGLTAAWLFGLWAPRPGQELPLEMAYPTTRSPLRTPVVACRRLVVDEGEIESCSGVPVTTPERTCFDLMRRSARVQAVVWADSFLHGGLVTADGLRRCADERPHWPHVRKVRDALLLARSRAASPMETRLRLVIVDGGLPEPPLINEAVRDRDGRFLGSPDLAYDEPRYRIDFGIEYDGKYHETAQQHASDDARENRLLIGGMPLLRYVADDVYQNPARVVAEVAAMLRRAA